MAAPPTAPEPAAPIVGPNVDSSTAPVDQEFDWQIVPRVTRQKWRNPNAPPTPAIQAADGDYLDDDPPTKPKSRAPRTFKPGKKAGRPKKVILQTVATAVPVTRLPDIFEEVMSHVAKMGESELYDKYAIQNLVVAASLEEDRYAEADNIEQAVVEYCLKTINNDPMSKYKMTSRRKNGRIDSDWRDAQHDLDVVHRYHDYMGSSEEKKKRAYRSEEHASYVWTRQDLIRFKEAFLKYGYSSTANRKISDFIGNGMIPSRVVYFKYRLKRMHEQKSVQQVVESEAFDTIIKNAPDGAVIEKPEGFVPASDQDPIPSYNVVVEKPKKKNAFPKKKRKPPLPRPKKAAVEEATNNTTPPAESDTMPIIEDTAPAVTASPQILDSKEAEASTMQVDAKETPTTTINTPALDSIPEPCTPLPIGEIQGDTVDKMDVEATPEEPKAAVVQQEPATAPPPPSPIIEPSPLNQDLTKKRKRDESSIDEPPSVAEVSTVGDTSIPQPVSQPTKPASHSVADVLASLGAPDSHVGAPSVIGDKSAITTTVRPAVSHLGMLPPSHANPEIDLPIQEAALVSLLHQASPSKKAKTASTPKSAVSPPKPKPFPQAKQKTPPKKSQSTPTTSPFGPIGPIGTSVNGPTAHGPSQLPHHQPHHYRQAAPLQQHTMPPAPPPGAYGYPAAPTPQDYAAYGYGYVPQPMYPPPDPYSQMYHQQQAAMMAAPNYYAPPQYSQVPPGYGYGYVQQLQRPPPAPQKRPQYPPGR